jgi:flagellar hook-associated protein 2
VTDPVRISGFFATFDTEAVIAQLTEARLLKVGKLEVEEARAQVRSQLLADIETKLAALLVKSATLTGEASISKRMSSVSGTGVTASAGTNAAVGSFDVDVLQLATGTTVGGTQISAGLDSTSAMNKANFGTTPTNGTYTIATASGGSSTLTVGATVIDNTSLLNASNFGTAVTSGNFTIATATGGSAVIAVDITTQSLDNIITSINGAGVGITATISNDANGRANQITLTSTQGDITLGDAADTSNFLTSTNLTGATGTTTMVSTSAISVQMSLAEVITDINGAGVGITATIVNDANGRPNLLSLTSVNGDIDLGNATDTSNLLTATNLLASTGTTTRQSTQSIARVDSGELMNIADFFGGPPAAGPHTFTINGVSVAYDTSTDTLTDVINRINSSGAGVIARYDNAADTVTLEQTATGSLAITMADDGGGGDFLSKMGLLTASQTMGVNAQYSIDGGPTQYSSSNTVTPMSGVSLELKEVTTVGTPDTVTITRDVEAAVATVTAWVADYNTVIEAIDSATNIDIEDPSLSGELSGDASLGRMKTTLRSYVTAAGLNVTGSYTNLNEIGIGFGDIGAALGETDVLVFDDAKLRTALDQDPLAAQQLLSVFSLASSLDAGGTGSIASISGNYTGAKTGRYAIVDDGVGNLTATFTPTDGSAETTTTATVLAGGTTTDLIPGVTVQIAGTLVAGNNTIRVNPSKASPLELLKEYVEGQAGSGEVLSARQDAFDAIAKDIRERMTIAEERIETEMDNLRRKFLAMELAQARAQSLFSVLDGLTAQLAALRPNSN